MAIISVRRYQNFWAHLVGLLGGHSLITFVCLSGPQKLLILYSILPVVGRPLIWGSASSPRTILLFFFTTLMFLGRGMEREIICLIKCSTQPNITCITGRYSYICPGHIHWGRQLPIQVKYMIISKSVSYWFCQRSKTRIQRNFTRLRLVHLTICPIGH